MLELDCDAVVIEVSETASKQVDCPFLVLLSASLFIASAQDKEVLFLIVSFFGSHLGCASKTYIEGHS